MIILLVQAGPVVVHPDQKQARNTGSEDRKDRVYNKDENPVNIRDE